MKSHVVAFGLLGSVVASPAEVLHANVEQQTYCITYESTYLVPVSIGTNSSEAGSSTTYEPSILSSEAGSSTAYEPSILSFDSTTLPVLTTTQDLVTTDLTIDTEQPTLPTDTATAPPTIEPSGQRIIFLITPSGTLNKRDVGGFVGNGNPDVCTFATDFTLGQGRLFDGSFPIAYSGEDFQPLGSSSFPSDDAITTTFSSVGGVLQFSNPLIPGGRASFCQTPSDGQVYITYTSRPTGCVFISLTIYGAERCINGKIDGLDTSTTQSSSAQFSIPPFTETGFSDSPETELPTISETNTPPIPPFTETGFSDSPETELPNISETDTLPIPPFTETDFSDSPETELPSTRTSDDGQIIFPTMPVNPTRSWSNQTFGVSTTTRGPVIPTPSRRI